MAAMTQRSFLVFVFAASLLVLGGRNSLAADPARFYFFSPDWRPGNLGLLAENVDALAKVADVSVTFQAFARYEDFVDQLRTTPPEFLIAPTWVEQLLPPSVKLTPMAQAERHSKSNYRKALMTRAAIVSVDDLAKGSIAATVFAMGPEGEQALLDAFNLDGTRTRVVPVQKDIDALLALSFEQVDAALVTSPQFEAHARVNPAMVNELHIIGFSPPIDFPVLYTTAPETDERIERLASAFIDAKNNETGEHLLDILGFEGFRSPQAAPELLSSAQANREN